VRVVIPTVGTRGDVQPYVALGVGLREAGHDVRLVTLGAFESLVTGAGLGFAPVRAEFLELLNTPEGKKAIAGGNPFGVFKKVMPMLRAMLDEVLEASQDADAIVFHPKTLASEHVAQRLGIPAVRASVVPLYTPTTEFATPVIRGGRSMGALLNRVSWGAFLKAVYSPYIGMIDEWREQTLHLPPMKQSPVPVPLTLYGYSEKIVPRPADWPPDVVVTGSWFLESEAGWEPSAELLGFLDAGEPPVYVGFGSMPSRDAGETTALVVEALRRAGVRGLIFTGLGGMADIPSGSDVLVMGSAPHGWVFPRVAAVVHHGGAGTTAAGLRAGRPTLVVPTFGDQPFWGARVAALGAGPRPIPARRLTAARLADAIALIARDAGMRRGAEALGASMSAERGVDRAVAEIEALCGRTDRGAGPPLDG
jgi:sterol 3beta-glucosyltransferase